MVDHYQTLGVSPSASAQEIRAAYLALIKRHHPDAQQHQQGQDERVRELNQAYAVLRDSGRRAEHDAARQLAARPAFHPQAGPAPAFNPAPSNKQGRRNVPAFALVACTTLASVVIGAKSETAPYTLSSEAAPEVEYAIVLPSGLPPVEAKTAAHAYSDADYILSRGSPDDAATHSGQCFNELALDPGLDLLDRCIAFDLAAAHWLGRNGREDARGFFSAAAMNQRHLSAFSALSFGAATAGPRVAELRRLIGAEAGRPAP